MNSKHYLIYDSNNDCWYDNVLSLAQFCKTHSLNESCMRDVAKGRQKFQHRGFFCVEKQYKDKEILTLKIQQKKYNDLVIRLNKIKKPLDKVKRYNQSDKYLDFIKNIETNYQELHVNQRMSCSTIANEIGISPETVRKHFIKNNLERLNNPLSINHSSGEIELREFLEQITGDKFESTRKVIFPYELDCYSEKYKIAFEYCGVYWHSELFKDKRYHYNKMKSCETQGIRLITIFENEWNNKKEQIQQFIKSTLGIFDRRIYARECIVKQIDVCNDLFNDSHIQGAPNKSNECFGLFFEEELVGGVSYATHHRNSQQFCLNRLAFKQNIQIVGGTSKLIKHSINKIKYDEIITWSDNRWSTGEIYKTCGFYLDNELPPDYMYIRGNEYRTKQSMKKTKKDRETGKTERELARLNGWLRIYDCGKKRWKYKK